MSENIEYVRIANAIQTAQEWTDNNPVLYKGEIGIEEDTGLRKTGNGGKNWVALPYDINITSGSGKFSNQSVKDAGIGTTFSFVGKNPNATNILPELNGNIEYGAIGEYATVFGGKASAQGKRSLAEGTTTIALGKYSHVEGDNSVTIGDDSHAEGYATVSKGVASHSEGGETLASGIRSHAEGSRTYAQGDASHAEGVETKAVGIYSHTEGDWTYATGKASHAEGRHTIAAGEAQHVQGVYNIESESFAHIVGGGTSDEDRKNIHTLDWNGNAIYAGDIFANNNKKLATEDWVKENASKYVDISGKLDANGWTNSNGVIGIYTDMSRGIYLYPNDGVAVTNMAGTMYYNSIGMSGTVDAHFGGERFSVTYNGISIDKYDENNNKHYYTYDYPNQSGTLLVDKDIKTLQNRITELETAFSSITIGGSY